MQCVGLVVLLVATLQLAGCQLSYSYNRDGKGTKAFTAGFAPGPQDYKAIKELRR